MNHLKMVAFAAICSLVISSPTLAQGFVCAEGGGNPGKGLWANEVFGWMVEKGNHGPAVIIGAIALDAEDQPDNREALFKQLGAKSCTSLIINEKNADAQETYDAIAAATIVFIRGGAQERYVNWWKGTKTEAAIHAVFDKGGVIAGTSAGCAILGEVTYDSKNGSLKPTEALEDACHPHLTLTTDFLNLVPGVIFDTHFTERGRIARLPVMLAHCRDDLHKDDLIGVGVDPRTALCVEPDGKAMVRGEGTITLIEFTLGTRTQLDSGKPPAVAGALYSRLPAGTKLDMKTLSVTSSLVKLIQHGPSMSLKEMTLDGRGGDTAVPPQGDEDANKEKPALPLPVVRWPSKEESLSSLFAAQNTWAHASDILTQVTRRIAFSPGRVALLLGIGNQAQVMSTDRLLIREAEHAQAESAVLIDGGAAQGELADWSEYLQQARALAQTEVWGKRMNALIDKRGIKAQLTDYLRQHPNAATDGEELKNDPALQTGTDATNGSAGDATNLARRLRLRQSSATMRAVAASAFMDEDGRKELAKLNPDGRAPLDSDEEAELLHILATGPKGTPPSIYRAKLHILPPGWSIDLNSGEVTRPPKQPPPTPQKDHP